jgi:hypothetical protein
VILFFQSAMDTCNLPSLRSRYTRWRSSRSNFFKPSVDALSQTSCNTSPSQSITQMQRTSPSHWIESSSKGSGPLKKSINRKPLRSVFAHKSSSLLPLQKLSAICLPFSLIQCRTETQNRNHFFLKIEIDF